MLAPDPSFGSQDCWLSQPCQTFAYARMLQYLVERVQPLFPGELHCLVESMVELWQAMELLASFSDEEVLAAALPSNWVEVSLPRLAEPTLWDCSQSCSRSCQAHQRGSLSAAHSINWPNATKEADMPTAPSQEKTLLQSHCKPPCPMPGFAEIRQSLWGKGSRDSHPSVIIGIPPEEAEDQDQYEVMGSSMMAAHLLRHPTSGDMYIDLLTCTMSIVDLGPNPMADDCPSLALPEMSNWDWSPASPFVNCVSTSCPLQFYHPACMPWCLERPSSLYCCTVVLV